MGRSAGLCACSATPLPSPRPGPGSTISLTSCTPREPLSTGMLERVWRRENSLRQGKILLPLRRTTRRLALTLLRLEMTERATNTRVLSSFRPLWQCSKSLDLKYRVESPKKKKNKKPCYVFKFDPKTFKPFLDGAPC